MLSKFTRDVRCLAFTVVAAGFGAASVSAEQQISIGSTSATSPFYGYFVAVSNIINETVPGVSSKVVESGAAIENLKRMGRGQLDMGLITTNALANAYAGKGSFDGNPVPSKLLWVDFTAPQMTLVRRDSDIDMFADLEGRKLHTGMRGSATEATTDAVLATLSISVDAFRGGGEARPSPPPLRAIRPPTPSATPPACSASVPLDSDGNRVRSFGGVASQVIGKTRTIPTKPESARFARPETRGHSETEIAVRRRLSGSHPPGEPL